MLEQKLKEKYLTPAWLARVIGVSRATVIYWIQKKNNPRPKYYPAIAKALGLTEEQVKEMFA
jgi:transcriptional regulator with XRE-family HTH domain